MNNFDHDYTAMSIHKSREQELLSRAEENRKAKSLREQITYRVRRAIRINNDPVR
ncbi:MAG: hypothetical protein AAF846_13470 [Chloroflexota bacterium]